MFTYVEFFPENVTVSSEFVIAMEIIYLRSTYKNVYVSQRMHNYCDDCKKRYA